MHGMRMHRLGKYTLAKFTFSCRRQASKPCHFSVQFHSELKQPVPEGRGSCVSVRGQGPNLGMKITASLQRFRRRDVQTRAMEHDDITFLRLLHSARALSGNCRWSLPKSYAHGQLKTDTASVLLTLLYKC